MDGRNLNEIYKQDPSLRNGEYSIVFERQCDVEMKIIEQSIIDMVKDKIQNVERMNFKILVKGKERHNSSQDEAATDRVKHSNRSNGLTAEENPDTIRIEIMSDNDFFFQYIYE